jgi:hypothetical protein
MSISVKLNKSVGGKTLSLLISTGFYTLTHPTHVPVAQVPIELRSPEAAKHRSKNCLPNSGRSQKLRRQPPHLNRVVKTAADQSFVLRIKSQFHPSRMTLQRARHFAGIHPPQLDSPAQIGAG